MSMVMMKMVMMKTMLKPPKIFVVARIDALC
jgi:hypothetical protein